MPRARPGRPAPAERPLIGVFGSATSHAEIDALTPSVLEGWMGMGPRVREFEGAFGERLGTPFVMADSGSNALQLAVEALELPPASDVVVPSFTWIACAHAVALSGHRPVFADVDVDTGNVNVDTIERALTERTRAVMVVHYAGLPVDMDSILELRLPVIEDAAHAVDSAVDGRPCGTMGDAGVFSFDSVKNLATPDGGGVASRRGEVLERVRQLRYCGIGGSGFDRAGAGRQARWWEVAAAAVFPRAIPNDVSASIGLAQLDKLAENQARRREIWNAYQAAFGELSWLALPPDPGPRERHSYFTYLVRVLDGRRDALAHHLLALRIYTTLRYQPLHLVLGQDNTRGLPNAEALGEQGLNLPLHPSLTADDVERVIDGVRNMQ